MNKVSSAFFLALACFVSQEPVGHELRVEQDKENVVSSRLEGEWQTNESLSEHLTGKEGGRERKLSFKSDSSIATKVPAEYAKFFTENKMKIYMAGTVKTDETECPFVMTQIHGNPHVFLWLEKDGKEFGNSESFNVMLVVAENRENDLLFVGGDFNNEAFKAFGRSKPNGDE